MQIKLTNILLVNTIIIGFLITSCTKDKAEVKTDDTGATINHVVEHGFRNRVSQDPLYRNGKWVSARNPATSPYGTLQDTLWFVDDTLSGYSNHGLPYEYRKFRFETYYITFYISGHDSIRLQCYTFNDTFQIIWGSTQFPNPFNYIKLQ